MQWIFMLVGLLCGALVSQSGTGALLGLLVGVGLGQALKLQGLEEQNAKMREELALFAEAAQALKARLLKLEQSPKPAGAPVVAVGPAAPAEVAQRPEPEVIAAEITL
ncbi:MAG TPA: hypothetical protein VJA19_02550, partial [Pseudomonas sp.]|nr:hypothetical protein [Pseudomonas sp.]